MMISGPVSYGDGIRMGNSDSRIPDILFQNRNIGFLRTLRELANWHTSDDTNIEKIVNGIQANNNWNR